MKVDPEIIDCNALKTHLGIDDLLTRISALEVLNFSDLSSRITILEAIDAALDMRVSTAQTDISSLKSRATALESGAGSFSVWSANKAAKMTTPSAPVNLGTGLTIVGVGVGLSMAGGTSIKSAIEEIQAFLGLRQTNVDIGRGLMSAT